MNLLKGSAVLKLSALVAALLTYAYVQNEINHSQQQNAYDASYKLLKLTAKNLPVKARLSDSAAPGHRVLEDQIVVSPDRVTVIGPEALLQDAVSAETSLIDMSEYSRTVTKQVPLESVGGVHVVGEPYMIVLTIPVEKIPEAAPAASASPEAAPAAPVSE